MSLLAENRTACAVCLAGSSRPIAATRSCACPGALVATITRIPREEQGPGTGVAAVCILDPDRNSCTMAEALFRAYGLTQSEAHLAMNIVAGLSLTDAAARMRVSTQTARTYLKQAFWKTGTHRQADLVRRVLNSVMRIGQLA